MKFQCCVPFLHPCLKPLKVACFHRWLCFWHVCLNILYPLMEARSCVHNVMAFKREVNGGKMAGAILAHKVLLSRRKRHEWRLSQDVERSYLQKAEWNPLPLSSAACCQWQANHTPEDASRLLWGQKLAGSILPPTDNFKACPHSSNPVAAAAAVPSPKREPIKILHLNEGTNPNV